VEASEINCIGKIFYGMRLKNYNSIELIYEFYNITNVPLDAMKSVASFKKVFKEKVHLLKENMKQTYL
jgi:hypothetical protein